MADAAQVTVIAKFEAQPGKAEQLEPVLMEMIVPTRAESGCINYDLHRQKDNPAVFYFYENWVSQDALDAHMKTPHFTQMDADAKPLLTEPMTVTLCHMESERAG